MKEKTFNNPNSGPLTMTEVAREIKAFLEEAPDRKYELLVGTDSNGDANNAHFVAAIIIYRVGKGARYFWRKTPGEKPYYSLQERIHQEVTISLEVAQEILAQLQEVLSPDKKINYDFQIHIDVGENGPTQKIIKEVVGMVKGNGFKASIKPESFAASNVADKYC